MSIVLFFCLFSVDLSQSFIPHPSIRLGAQAGESVTHSEITQIGFARSLSRFFVETRAIRQFRVKKKKFTIDELYRLAFPKFSSEKIHVQSYPLKSVLDQIIAENAMVDIEKSTKKLPAAHFDSEAFSNGSRRMIKIRNLILQIVVNRTGDIEQARQLLGQVLHTLQDFYSHSNWVELGKRKINERLGLDENIGRVASPKQSTCRSEACHQKIVPCTFFQKITLRKCPLKYYECKDNIRTEIIKKGLLTSGYSVNQFNEDGQPIEKPKNVDKCSHGSIMDDSSHQPAHGGINKDTVVPIYSPRFDLHFKAAEFAVLATERYFDDLRKDLNNENFDRLFAIHPTADDLKRASQSIAQMRKFRFFTSSISSGLQMSSQILNDLQRATRHRIKQIRSKLFSDEDEDIPFR